MSRFILSLAAFSTAVLGCADHNVNARFGGTLNRRADPSEDWAYEASYNWGMINSNYSLCQIGTTQSPIQLPKTNVRPTTHIPTFSYGTPIVGELFNWGYGPAFTLNGTDITTHPTVTFDDETVYLIGWHIHAPADHSVEGDRTKAELHLVHADAAGKPRAVLAFRIDPGKNDSAFFKQFTAAAAPANKRNKTAKFFGRDNANSTSPGTDATTSPYPGFGSTTRIPLTMDAELALNEVNNFADFWTYQGSLTSPPCTEGIRFFVAKDIMYVSNRQMQEILLISTFSARVEQEVWMHQINM